MAAALIGGQSAPRQSLPPVAPSTFPAWMTSKGGDHLFYKPARYNWAINRLPRFARDMYATGVGHAMAYEALARGRGEALEGPVYEEITAVLKNPPRNPVDEASLSPAFQRKFGVVEKVFDWSHTLHFQTIDVLADARMSDAEKEAEIEKLWSFYTAQPYAITGLPMNMDYLDSFSYSGTFRERFPKVNGLFWGYHWLQTVNYDMLFRVPAKDQAAQYDVLGDRYHEAELTKTDREFMPMTAELSPRFAKRFPAIANSFDNLHMLHDNVNDILAQEGMSEGEKQKQVMIAVTRVLASTHEGEAAGAGAAGTLHDHRHAPSQPGMGWMRGMDGDEMYMAGMGWMDMSECAHCSVPLPNEEPWGATVTADGWTMTVRCLMCARDMAGETPGRAIIRAATEDPSRLLVMISDEEGNWTSNIPEVVFLEKMEEHPECMEWSRAFTTRAAFDRYLDQHPEYKDEKPLQISEWSAMNHGTPATYRRIDRPSPYRRSE